MPFWYFAALAPGMDSQTEGTNSWIIRNHHSQACSPTSAVSIDAKKAESDAGHAEVVSASLASPNRVVIPSSSHSFSARAAPLPTSDGRESPHTSCKIQVQQLVTPDVPVPDPDPSILVGLSCRYQSAPNVSHETEEQYNTRTLSTPLLWEEPRSFFFDCRRSGLYLWSEDGLQFGRKIADRCLKTPTNPSAGSNVTAQTDIQLSWKGESIGISVTDGKASEVTNYTWQLPKGVSVDELVPTVTFLTESCRASFQ